jgi:hypothetical protein
MRTSLSPCSGVQRWKFGQSSRAKHRSNFSQLPWMMPSSLIPLQSICTIGIRRLRIRLTQRDSREVQLQINIGCEGCVPREAGW